MSGDGVQQAGLTATGFTAGEQVAVGEGDVDGVAELVDPDEDLVEHRQARSHRHPIPTQWVTGVRGHDGLVSSRSQW
ncbi:hypothetical protein D3C83_212820 [compost metagenome]